jgi:phosphotransferase system  glucose/maltose/N-acetylglucosamine-specific IIC component
MKLQFPLIDQLRFITYLFIFIFLYFFFNPSKKKRKKEDKKIHKHEITISFNQSIKNLFYL